MNKDYLRSVAEYVIEGHTIKETANYFGKSESSIKKYLAVIRDSKQKDFDAVLASKLQLVQEKIILKGVKNGGEKGKRKKSYQDFTAEMYAEAYISGKSLRELAELSHIPKSTLYDMICSVQDSELKEKIQNYVLYKEAKIIDGDKSEVVWKR